LKKVNIRMIAILAMLIAVSIVLARLLGFYLTPSLRVSFDYFPIILAGVCFGAWRAPLWAASPIFWDRRCFPATGFSAAYPWPDICRPRRGPPRQICVRKHADRWWKYMVVSCAADLLCNLLWGTFALSLLYGMPFVTYLLVRAPLKLAIAAIDAQLVYSVHRALRPVLVKWRQNQ
jgi:hypothetical protein